MIYNIAHTGEPPVCTRQVLENEVPFFFSQSSINMSGMIRDVLYTFFLLIQGF